MQMSRRDALRIGISSMACYSTLAATPNWISKSAFALDDSGDDKRIVVILQQAGGNDGLNTVIPYTDEAYRALRPKLAVPLGEQLTLDNQNGFHPQLRRLSRRFVDKGQVGIVQNVGYKNPNLSHFSSMDYYEFGMVPGEPAPTAGWAETHECQVRVSTRRLARCLRPESSCSGRRCMRDHAVFR